MTYGIETLKGGGKLLPKLKPLGTAVTVISATMSVVTLIGWAITRRQDQKKKQEMRDKITKK